MSETQALVESLDLAKVIEVWGIERVEDVLPHLEQGYAFVAVHDGGGQSRVLPAKRVAKADPEMILDMLPGGLPAMYVDANIPQGELPEHRPLLVRRGARLIGLLGQEELNNEPTEVVRPSRWALPAGGADARAAAMAAVDLARETFRDQGIPLMLDIQESRVEGDGALVKDLLDHLLEESLSILSRSGGGTAVYVTVGQGEAGLWIGVEDNGAPNVAISTDMIFSEEPTDDLSILALRRMRDRVVRSGGKMRVIPTRTGTRFMALLPAPKAS